MAVDPKTGAIVSGSPSDDKGAKGGGSPPLEELQAENKRKAEEITSLKSSLSQIQAEIAELKEAAEERELTQRETAKLHELESDVKTAAKQLRGKQELAPWIQIAKEEAEDAGRNLSLDAILNNEFERANDYIDDVAEKNGMTVKEMARELGPYAIRYADRRPERRNQLAYRDWEKSKSKEKSLEEREKALKAKEDEELKFRERGKRIVRDETMDKKLEDAQGREKIDILRDLIQTGTEQQS